ncbi:MFS transporter [Catellatospora vulcania]|uniref:MFS transporter n=1 Tax=Catellatospora vulcania TaxID=1460450 RepID=UPI0012D3ACC3|nr:MFS transporter [Catellatospora vulcania]
MTIHAAPAVGDPAPEQAEQAAALPVLAAAAVSTLATRMSLLVVPWLMLAADAGWRAVGLVSAAQVLAYVLTGPLGVALADRLRPVRLAVSADLLSAPALAGIAYFALPDSALAATPGLLGAAGLGVLAALAGALRAIGDRARDAVRRDGGDDGARPPRSGVVRALHVIVVLAGGAAAGVLAVRLGPAGVLWLDAVLCLLGAAMLVQAVTVAPRPDAAKPPSEVLSGEVLPAESGPGAGGTQAAGSTRSDDDARTADRDHAASEAAGDPASGSRVAAANRAAGDPQLNGRVAAPPRGDDAPADPAAAQADDAPAATTADPAGDGPAARGRHAAEEPRPAGDGRQALPIARTQARDLRRSAMAELRADGLVRRLAAVLFVTNLLAQAGAVLLVAAWMAHVLGEPDLLGLVGGAFVLGAVTGSVVLTGLTRAPSRHLLLALAFLAGGGAAAVAGGLPPVQLMVAVVAAVCGATLSSVTPPLGMLLSQRVPVPVRSRVGGFASGIAYLGVPLGTAAAAWALPRLELRWALAAAAGAYLVALLAPVFAYRTWRQLSAGAPAVLTGAARLPARLSVTLAYANGQWLVEVRKGRALLGSRHLVKSAEALNMLALLDVPGVRRSVEEALTVDQTEATRQAERMRSELAELEAKLAGLSEMAELSEVRLPVQQNPNSKAPSHG